MSGFAEDYNDVASRIAEFRARYPEGSLQPADETVPYRILEVGDQTFVVVVAAAYRTPDDQRPGVGMAQELIPGRTPYTRGSELQNAETSAWGRAIVAVGAADTKKGVASADEVRNRQAEADAPPVETDALWFEDIKSRLDTAANRTELEALVAEARIAYREHRMSPDDAAEWKRLTDARRGELEGKLVSA